MAALFALTAAAEEIEKNAEMFDTVLTDWVE